VASTPVRCRLYFSQLLLGGFVLPAFVFAMSLIFLFGVVLDPAKGVPLDEVVVGCVIFTILPLGAVRFALSLYQWVELDGAVVRGRKLLSRRLVVYRVEDLAGIGRGYVLRFRSGDRMWLLRRMMASLPEFIEALGDVHRRMLRLGVAPPDVGDALAAARERWAEGRASPSEAIRTGNEPAVCERPPGGPETADGSEGNIRAEEHEGTRIDDRDGITGKYGPGSDG
jgi:hypothetical protein